MTNTKSTRPERIEGTEPKTEPIEVWLTVADLKVTCLVVRSDESIQSLDVDSLSLRGGQREITGVLISWGYEPVGRWEYTAGENDEDRYGETVRQFRPAKKAQVILSGPGEPVIGGGRVWSGAAIEVVESDEP
jgi:hypothetical protein